MSDSEGTASARVAELLARYSEPQASTAWWLCDRHDTRTVAYKLIGKDLSSDHLTYGELRLSSERLASSFETLGIGPGDRVATLMGKSREYLVTLMAIWRLGAVHVPLFTAFAPAAVGVRIRQSHCKVIVCDETQRAKLDEPAAALGGSSVTIITTGATRDRDRSYHELLARGRLGIPAAALGGNAPIIHIYTSGTTGMPKGVIVPLRALASFQIYAEFGLALSRDDVFWNAADPGWAYGLYYGILAPLALGAQSLMVLGGFSAEQTVSVLTRFDVTNFAAAPTVYRSLRGCGMRPEGSLALRRASSAGEPLTPDVNAWSVATLGVAVHDHYGQTETGMLINNHHHPELRAPLAAGSMGRSMPGWTAAILKADAEEPAHSGEIGRVAIDLARSPLAWFRGYADDAARSAEKFSHDGRWYFTGDSGRVNEQGYFYFASRDDDVIIMAGYRIGPSEVEAILVSHSAVSECAVVAGPDEVRGEVLEAFVVLRADCAASADLTLDLQQWVKRRYAAHAYPRRVHYVDALPKTPSGKIQRFVLRRRLLEAR